MSQVQASPTELGRRGQRIDGNSAAKREGRFGGKEADRSQEHDYILKDSSIMSKKADQGPSASELDRPYWGARNLNGQKELSSMLSVSWNTYG